MPTLEADQQQDARFAAFLRSLHPLLVDGSVEDTDPFPDDADDADGVRESDDAGADDGPLPAGLRAAAGTIKHCGQEGRGYWNPATKTAFWVRADSDMPENGYDDTDEIRAKLGAVPGVEHVEMEAESPPCHDPEAHGWVMFRPVREADAGDGDEDDDADDALREKLAALEHDQWAHWTRWQIDNSSPEMIERWERQIRTPYAKLSEKEKDSDREWADKVLALVGDACDSGNDGVREAGTEDETDYALTPYQAEVREVDAHARNHGIMVAFFLPPDAAKSLAAAVPNGEPASNMHITLAYLGHTNDYTHEQLDNLPSIVARVARRHGALHGRVTGVEAFRAAQRKDDPETDVAYAAVDVPGLRPFRDDLVQALDRAGYHVSKDYQYTPHITLRYQRKGSPLPTLEEKPSLRLGRLSSAIGRDHYHVRLQGQPQDTDGGIWRTIRGHRVHIQDGVVLKGPDWLRGKHLMAAVREADRRSEAAHRGPREARSQQGAGPLIAIEGLDGSGKTTQIGLLAKRIQAETGLTPTISSWNSSPYVKPATKAMKKEHALDADTYSLIHAADLAQREAEVIRPALRAGVPVLCDRSWPTGIARGLARENDPDWLQTVYSFVRQPDLIIFLDVPPDAALARTKAERGGSSYYEAGQDVTDEPDQDKSFLQFQGAIHGTYRDLAGQHGFVTVDGDRAQSAVHGDIWKAVAPLLKDVRGQQQQQQKAAKRKGKEGKADG